MKTSHDPRHKKRRLALQQLFANSFFVQESEELARAVYEKRESFDDEIKKAAPAWPVEKLNRIDLSILRLAIYELQYTTTPPRVIIDEAVELAKEFGGEGSPSFINGVLGNILSKIENGVLPVFYTKTHEHKISEE